MRPEHASTLAAGGMAGALTTFLCWLLGPDALGILHHMVPDQVAIALTVLFTGLGGFLTHEWQGRKARRRAAETADNVQQLRQGKNDA